MSLIEVKLPLLLDRKGQHSVARFTLLFKETVSGLPKIFGTIEPLS